MAFPGMQYLLFIYCTCLEIELFYLNYRNLKISELGDDQGERCWENAFCTKVVFMTTTVLQPCIHPSFPLSLCLKQICTAMCDLGVAGTRCARFVTSLKTQRPFLSFHGAWRANFPICDTSTSVCLLRNCLRASNCRAFASFLPVTDRLR